jgi:hypothetical protein
MVRPAFWLGASAGLAALSAVGLWPRAVGGAAVGLAVGAVYLWMLVRRARSLPGLPRRKAVLAAQLGALARCLVVFAGFGAATRVWPAADPAWGAATLLVPVTLGILAVARGA